MVDDHKMFREGVKGIVEKKDTCEMIWMASDSEEAVEALKKEMPDVLLMDISIGFESGITFTKELVGIYPEIKIIALTMHHEEHYVINILEKGAKGYLLKDAGGEEMLNAIHAVSNGNTYYSKHASEVLIKHLTNGTKPKENNSEIPLTAREKEVLTLIANEYSNPEIAKELFISIRTVDAHRRNLLDKLDVKNTAGLVKKAIQYDLVDISDPN